MSAELTDVLAIDTCAGTSVARIRGTESRLAADPNPRAHAENLAPMIEAVGGAAGVDAIVVGVGPAPFTGLRVGIVTARVLSDALGVPVYGVSILDALARQAFDVLEADTLTVVTDARRREIYAASFTRAGDDDVRVVRAPAALPPSDPMALGPVVGTVDPAPEDGRLSLDVTCYARLARSRHAARIAMPTQPQYLREPDIHCG